MHKTMCISSPLTFTELMHVNHRYWVLKLLILPYTRTWSCQIQRGFIHWCWVCMHDSNVGEHLSGSSYANIHIPWPTIHLPQVPVAPHTNTDIWLFNHYDTSSLDKDHYMICSTMMSPTILFISPVTVAVLHFQLHTTNHFLSLYQQKFVCTHLLHRGFWLCYNN